MRIAYIGCVHFSFKALEHLLSLKGFDFEIVGVVTRENSLFNDDFCSLAPLAEKNKIPVYFAKGNNQDSMKNWLKEIEPDVIYCFGWSYLLKDSILSLPKLGVVGYHPAALPQNRGRHPIIWALALGLKETGSTFFFMNDGIDSGNILSQKIIKIDSEDDAATLYDKLVSVACAQIAEFTPLLISGRYHAVKQDESKATYWHKRGKEDGQIDWSWPATRIHNLVRALTRPYAGAHFTYNKADYKVWKTKLVNEKEDNVPAGEVIGLTAQGIIVKCGEGSICLVDYENKIRFNRGDSLTKEA